MYFSKPSGSSHGAKGTRNVYEQSPENLIQRMWQTEKVSIPLKEKKPTLHTNLEFCLRVTYPNPPGPLLMRVPNNIFCLNSAARSAIDFGALMNLSSGITPNSVAPQVLRGI